MILHQKRKRPEPWAQYRHGHLHRWAVPFYALEWLFEWVAHFLSGWVLLEVLEYLGTFSILIGVIFYFAESGDRTKQKHYQAWQVINTAQGKGGSGGRIEALQELNADRVPLVGVDLTDAFLQGIRLEHAQLLRSNFASADLRRCSLRYADLSDASLRFTNLRGADLHGANLRGASLKDADLFGADLAQADVSGSDLDGADLRSTNLDGLKWGGGSSVRLANIFNVRNAPSAFSRWAMQNGAVSLQSDEVWNGLQAKKPIGGQ